MAGLKISVSGIRGVWGDGLNLETLSGFIKAFVIYLKKRDCRKILIGRDARPTGKLISFLAAGVMNAYGIDVADCGIVPTPTVLLGVRKLSLGGGIIISASHNPIEWNALKLVGGDGLFLDEDDVKEINSYIGNDIKENPYNSIGKYEETSAVEDIHINEIMKNVSANIIMGGNFKVVLDPVNSAGGRIGAGMLKRLGCDVRMVNGEINGTFGRGAEPVPSNLSHLTSIVKDFRADAGFAQDPDADRLVVIDENGRVLSEEFTLALCVEHVLSGEKGDIVINYSTSMVNEFIARKYGVACWRTKVGEANVASGIISHKALIGGEGNGGVMYPRINLARDSLVGMALILEMMAKRNKKLSEIVLSLPHYFMKKEKFQVALPAEQIFDKIKGEFSKAEADETDGLRLLWEENGSRIWFHIRPSNTEPVIRIIGESDDESLLDDNLVLVKKLIAV